MNAHRSAASPSAGRPARAGRQGPPLDEEAAHASGGRSDAWCPRPRRGWRRSSASPWVQGRSPVGLTMPQLIRVALRRNPRRAQLLVSTVLGKHLPADPRVVAGAGRLLGALVALMLAGQGDAVPRRLATGRRRRPLSGDDPAALLDLFDGAGDGSAQRPACSPSGFAETATSLGHLVADQLGSAYLHSTRREDGEVPVAAEFAEPHSHAVGHLLRPRSPDLLAGSGPVVLVDDELSTGRTALNVIESLQAVAPRDRYVLAGSGRSAVGRRRPHPGAVSPSGSAAASTWSACSADRSPSRPTPGNGSGGTSDRRRCGRSRSEGAGRRRSRSGRG